MLNVLNIFDFVHEVFRTGFVLDKALNLIINGSLLMFLGLLINVSVTCTTIMNDLLAITHKVYLLNSNKKALKAIKTLSQQIYQRRQNIRSAFFDINWGLMLKVKIF